MIKYCIDFSIWHIKLFESDANEWMNKSEMMVWTYFTHVIRLQNLCNQCLLVILEKISSVYSMHKIQVSRMSSCTWWYEIFVKCMNLWGGIKNIYNFNTSEWMCTDYPAKPNVFHLNKKSKINSPTPGTIWTILTLK